MVVEQGRRSQRRSGRNTPGRWADGTKELTACCADCARRGMRAPVLAVGGGALGFWKAPAEVSPDTRAPIPRRPCQGR